MLNCSMMNKEVMKKNDQQKSIYLPTINHKLQTTSGFSLIELLVAIAVVAILTTLGVVNFVGIRERGRDTQRKASLNEIKTALEFYKIDIGFYPPSLPACGSPFAAGSAVYMKKIPCDPINVSPLVYTYIPDAAPASGYRLRVCLENELDTSVDATPLVADDTFCTGANKAYVGVNP